MDFLKPWDSMSLRVISPNSRERNYFIDFIQEFIRNTDMGSDI